MPVTGFAQPREELGEGPFAVFLSRILRDTVKR